MKKTYINGHIFVGDSEDHFANDMIVENGRIKWIGNDPGYVRIIGVNSK